MIGLNRVIMILMKLVGWTIYNFLMFFLYLKWSIVSVYIVS